MIETVRTAWLLCELRLGSHRHQEALQILQGSLLRRAVAHAQSYVPFYRRLWSEAGVDPDRVLRLDDLRRLPIIAADRVRAAAESGELLAASGGAETVRRFSTGGSSGRPLPVPRGAVESRLWRAGGLRMQLERGFRWWDTTVQLDAAPAPSHPLQKLGLAPAVWIPQELPLDEQLDRLVTARARFVFGHVTALRRIGRVLAERRVRVSSLQTVFSIAEILDDDSRATIGAAFGVDPIDVYGMTEVGFIGWQCEKRASLHVNADLVVVEILCGDVPARPGEIGRVVVTDLRGRTMPLLRYDTGDLARATAGPCACGRTLPTMGAVEGRSRHSFSIAGGRTLTQRAVMNHLAGTLRMGEYRLRRQSERRFLLEVTPRAFAAGVGEAEVRRALCGLLGDIDLRVEAIEALPAGLKTHAVVDDGTLSN